MDSHMPPLSFQIIPNTQPTPEVERIKLLENPGFGKIFTDHMAVIEWSQEKGWHGARIVARQPFELDPAAAVLHYAQEILEGLKAYRGAGGEVLLFRPEQNARRFQRSAKRLAMPVLAEADFIGAIEALLQLDQDWIPEGDEASLYLRPFMFAKENFLGVRSASHYIFCVIATPVGAYFKGEGKPVTVWVEGKTSRAAPGGTGAAKCGGNYAASLQAQAMAAEKGCDQVLFLDAIEHRYVEELGGMNIFFVLDNNRLVTPPLSGTILEGITRDSILMLARDRSMVVEERPYSFDELLREGENGTLREVFACGTAAVISSIGTLRHEGGGCIINKAEVGELTRALRAQLVDIQRGRGNDPHQWVKHVRAG